MKRFIVLLFTMVMSTVTHADCTKSLAQFSTNPFSANTAENNQLISCLGGIYSEKLKQQYNSGTRSNGAGGADLMVCVNDARRLAANDTSVTLSEVDGLRQCLVTLNQSKEAERNDAILVKNYDL